MSIETEIMQKSFANEFEKIQVNFLHTAAFVEYRSKLFFRAYDLSPQQYNVMRILRGKHPECASMSYIAERMIDKQSNASRLVVKLVEKELVEYKQNKTDRRLIDVCINEKGLNLLAQIDEDIMQEIESIYNKFSEEELKLFNSFLDRIRE